MFTVTSSPASHNVCPQEMYAWTIIMHLTLRSNDGTSLPLISNALPSGESGLWLVRCCLLCCLGAFPAVVKKWSQISPISWPGQHLPHSSQRGLFLLYKQQQWVKKEMEEEDRQESTLLQSRPTQCTCNDAAHWRRKKIEASYRQGYRHGNQCIIIVNCGKFHTS